MDLFLFFNGYDAMGNLLAMDILNNSGFAYDNNGNLTKAAVKGIAYQYAYDQANHLAAVKNTSGKKYKK